jgi:type VI secretion system protein ImpM
VSDAAVTPPPGAASRDRAVGFYGKIPARGDFVGTGLPRGFVGAWDAWMQLMLVASRRELGEEWLPAWLEAPIWRFALAPGLCSTGAVIGLWLPSVDRVGRHFPLTLALVADVADPLVLLREHGGFFATAEQAGRSALEEDLAPTDITQRLAAPAVPTDDAGVEPSADRSGGAIWWSEGGPRVPPGMFSTPALPEAAAFTAMLDARMSLPQPHYADSPT